MATEQLTKLIDRHLSTLDDVRLMDENERTFVEQLVQYRDDFASAGVRLTLAGLFSSGKSTILNGIMGHDILPRKILPTTGIITKVLYGHDLRAQIVYHDNRQVDIPFQGDSRAFAKALADAIQIRWDENAVAVPTTGIEAIHIYLPNDLLKHGYILIDTPGLHDANAALTAQTYRQLSNTDIVLLVFNNSLGERERELLATIRDTLVGNVLFLFNHNPNLNEEQDIQEILDWVRNEICDAANPNLGIHIFTVRALDALTYRMGQEAAEAGHAHPHPNNGRRGHEQLVHLESFLRELAADGRHIHFAQQSRGAVLREKLRLMQSHFDQSTHMLSAELNIVQDAHTTQHNQAVQAFDESVESSKLVLDRLLGNIGMLGQTLISSTESKARTEMHFNDEWHKSLSSTLNEPVSAFVKAINDDVEKALTPLGIHVAPFKYEPTVSISAGNNPGTRTGAIVGGALGLFGGLIGAGVGAGVGASVGSWLGDDQWKDNSMINVRAGANDERITIDQAARAYISNVYHALDTYHNSNRPKATIEPRIIVLQSQLARAHRTLHWINEFLEDLEHILKTN